MKNIFLSVDIPLLESDEKKYTYKADIIAIRDAIVALTTVVLPYHKLILSGPSSIASLIYYVMKRLNLNIKEHVTLYQSKFFEEHFSEDNNKFENIVFTDVVDDDREKSLLHMRHRILDESEFAAGIFMGGMEGVEQEYDMFIKKHPKALVLPIASTGAAARKIYDEQFTDKNERLVKDYTYMSLFRECLIDKI